MALANRFNSGWWHVDKRAMRFAARDAAYRKALGLDVSLGELPASIGTVPEGSNASKGRRRKFERKGKFKARNTTMKKAVSNVK